MKHFLRPLLSGLAITGAALMYFLQPASAAVMMGGTASGMTTVMVMTHFCNPTVQSEANFLSVEAKANGNKVGALAQTVLACPTVLNPGNMASSGAVASPNMAYQYELLDSRGMIHPWNEGVFKQHKLCESDINLDVNGDGKTSSGTCLDISHYEFTVPTGSTAVIQKSPPMNTRLGTLRFTPTELAANNDRDSLVAFYPGNGVIALNTAPDTDHMVMLHIYNFQKVTDSSSSSQSSMSSMHNSASSMSSMHSGGSRYYPSGGPSSYYVLPGQMLGFFGRNFAPYETVRLFNDENAVVGSFTTDGGGNFDRGNVVTVAANDSDSIVPYRFVGSSSNTTVNFNVKIGRYYPQVTPSSFYVPKGQTFGVSATGFAPNEQVILSVNGNIVTRQNADGGGNLYFNAVQAPMTGTMFTIEGRGAFSGNTSSANVYIMP